MNEFIDEYLRINENDNLDAARFALEKMFQLPELRSKYRGMIVSEDLDIGYIPNRHNGTYYLINSGMLNINYLLKGDRFILLEADNGSLKEVRTKKELGLLAVRKGHNAARKELHRLYESLITDN